MTIFIKIFRKKYHQTCKAALLCGFSSAVLGSQTLEKSCHSIFEKKIFIRESQQSRLMPQEKAVVGVFLT